MKIWLLYARFGGGHIAPAKAVKEQLEKKYGTLVEVKLVDIAEGINGRAKVFLENGYSTLINRVHWAWKIFYFVNELRGVIWMENRLIPKLMKKYFLDLFSKGKPDKIISFFHSFSPVMEVIKEENLQIPVAAVVTDPFTVPAVWFYFKNIDYVVFSPVAAESAEARGVSKDQVHVFSPILNTKYSLRLLEQKYAIRQKIGISANQKVVLIIGGGDGLAQGEKALKSLLKNNIDTEFIVVCGRNEVFKTKIEKVARKYPQKKVRVYGFIDFVHELMAIADVVIAKAGASVTMEAVLLKKPIIFIHYIWEQEKGNMEFVVQNNLGFFVPKIKQLSGKVQAILSNTVVQQKILSAYQNIVIKNGTAEVADFIYEYK